MFGIIKNLFRKKQPEPMMKLIGYPQATVVRRANLKSQDTIDWGLEAMGIPELWKITQGEGVKVAILDTGIAADHPDLKDAIVAAKDFTGSKSGFLDRQSHGSHCAGIVGARNNGVGVIGVAPKCQFIIGKVLGDNGSGQYEWIEQGMYWALEQGADIISMSLGGPVGTPALEKACKEVMKKAILICAAGNSGSGGWGESDTIGFPGAYPGVICVGSINSHKDRSQFSSVGKNLSVMAPGENILSCVPPDKYARYSGTSMATPFVAGVAALILSKHRQHGGGTPCESQAEMFSHLTKVAVDTGDPGWDSKNGWGIINPKESIAAEHTFGERLRMYLSITEG